MAPRRRSVVPTIDLKVTRPSIDSLQPNWMGDGRLNKDRFAQLSILLLFELGSGVHTHRERAPRRWWRRLLTVIGRQNLFARLLLLFRYRYLFSLSSFFWFFDPKFPSLDGAFLAFFFRATENVSIVDHLTPSGAHTHTHTHTHRGGSWRVCDAGVFIIIIIIWLYLISFFFKFSVILWQ